MSVLAISITVGLALFSIVISSVIFSICLYRLNKKCKQSTANNQSAELLFNELQLTTHELTTRLNTLEQVTNTKLLEVTQVSNQLEHRIKALQEKITSQEQTIEQWHESQGQDKLYSRAFKLAEKGADVDEIIVECELPRAEAEMLLSVYRQRN